MSETKVICKATKDTFMRFGVLLVALWGFGLYFFYDAAVGYKLKNDEYFSYQAFAQGGAEIQNMSPTQWMQKHHPSAAIIETTEHEGQWGVLENLEGKSVFYPTLSPELSPEELQNYELMSKSWNDAWLSYSSRQGYSIKPDKPHDLASIKEQWVAGGIAFALGFVLIYFIVRTARRQLSIEGDKMTVAGQSFSITEIESLDLRQWGPGYKGCATFTVKGQKLKADGMTYGGFEKKNHEPAEQFMTAVLAQYKGNIIEYAKEESPAKS